VSFERTVFIWVGLLKIPRRAEEEGEEVAVSATLLLSIDSSPCRPHVVVTAVPMDGCIGLRRTFCAHCHARDIRLSILES
jgi:hypothetical protein